MCIYEYIFKLYSILLSVAKSEKPKSQQYIYRIEA